MKQRLEDYLETVTEKLKCLPEAEREQQIEELRQHLELDVATHVAAGISPESAELAAIKQFGSPHILARQLQFAFWKRKLPRTDSLSLAILFATALTVCQRFDLLPISGWIKAVYYHNAVSPSTGPPIIWNLPEIFIGFLFGCAIATLAPRNAVTGVLLANGLFFAALLAGSGFQGVKSWLFSGSFLISWFVPSISGMIIGALLVGPARAKTQERRWRKSP